MKKRFEIKNNRLDGIPELKIFGEIDGYEAMEAGWFVNSTDENGKPFKKLRIRINSVGGSVTAAYSIIAEMNSFYQAGGEIETINEGVAASAAGWVFSFGTRGQRKIYQFAEMFLHEPQFADGTKANDYAQDSEEAQVLTKAFENLINIYTSATAIKGDDIRQMMSNETYINADDSVKLGFADEIVKIDNAPRAKNSLSLKEKMQFYNCADYQHNNKKVKQMNEEILNALDLSKADENAILNSIKALKNQLSEQNTTIEAQKKTIDEKETEIQNLRTEIENRDSVEIVNYVDALVAAKPTLAEDKDKLVKMAKDAGLENFKRFMPIEKQNPIPAIDKDIDEGDKEAKQIENAKRFKSMSISEREELKNKNAIEYASLVEDYENNVHKIM